MISEILTIKNEKGLHARASAIFVEIVEKFDARVTVSKDDMEVSGSSIMGLLMLGAAKGSRIKIDIEGTEAEQLKQVLFAFINNKFHEEK